MRLSVYLEAHDVGVPTFADRIGVAVSTVYRWLVWEKKRHGEHVKDGAQASRPDPDQIVKVQRATGGMVTVLDWTGAEPAPALVVPAPEPTEVA